MAPSFELTVGLEYLQDPDPEKVPKAQTNDMGI
jgi:hypothetical protein